MDDSINRDEFFKYMKNANIGVNVHYIPAYRHSYYIENFNFNKKDFPVTEDTFKHIITLPLFPKMEIDELEYIVKTINEYRI